ncbi:MAG: DUF4845 domain-containing protein [Pseudomonadales bacterium]|jgi:hypothetical protein|nr:DUF4845 domain-containing protein [Pseudomonadales bacterium]
MGGSGLSRQRGMSASGWFLVIALILGATSVGVRLVPHYLDHEIIDGQIRSLLENPGFVDMSRGQIHDRLKAALKRNNIREFDSREALEFEKRSGAVTMDLFYEVREPLFWNVDVILTFEEHYEKVL